MNFYSYKIRQGVDNFKINIFRCLRGARGHELDGAVHVPGVSWLFDFQVGQFVIFPFFYMLQLNGPLSKSDDFSVTKA